MKKKSDKIQNKVPLPLTEVKLRKELKPKLPKKGTEKIECWNRFNVSCRKPSRSQKTDYR